MSTSFRQFLRKLNNKTNNFIDKTSDFFSGDDPLVVLPYRGYANANNIFLKGRVIENEGAFEGKSDTAIQNLLESFKRFETDEYGGGKIRITILDQTFDLVTDKEGYFTLDSDWTGPTQLENAQWIDAEIALLDVTNEDDSAIKAKGVVFYETENADYGVITDVDDTVLQTNVTSLFKLKMLYATFFQNARQRLPMEGIVDLFKAFSKGGNGKRQNPIFYVSNSPWNIYDLLAEFMDIQQFPKGPILLRDYGLSPIEDFSGHKLNTIRRILKNHPNLPFIFLGDTAAEDADFYIELAKEFPNQVAAIYIRQTKDTKNARRIAQLIEANSNIEVVLTDSSKQMVEHARNKRFLI